jgi:hypothetical protein
MTAMSNAPMEPVKPEPFYQIWLKAFSRPKEQTYFEIAASPNANANSAYLWIFLTSLVTSVITFALQSVSMQRIQDYLPPEAAEVFKPGQVGGMGLIGAICGAPIAAAFAVLFFVIAVALIQWVAKMFGGKGDYTRMAYTLAAIAAPLNLLSAVLTLLAAIPFIGILFSLVSAVVGIYALVLYIMAVKGVNQFGWGEAIGSFFLPGLVFICLCACVMIGTFALLAPMIGEVFSTITQSLGGY